MVLAIFPAVVAIVGALMYALAANPKLSEMGRLAFADGLLAVCLITAGKIVKLF